MEVVTSWKVLPLLSCHTSQIWFETNINCDCRPHFVMVDYLILLFVQQPLKNCTFVPHTLRGFRLGMTISKKWNYSDFWTSINGRFQLGGWMRPNMSRSAQFLWSASSNSPLVGSCVCFKTVEEQTCQRFATVSWWNKRRWVKCRQAFQSWMGFQEERRKIKKFVNLGQRKKFTSEKNWEINATLSPAGCRSRS